MVGDPGNPKRLLGGQDIVSDLSNHNDFSQPQGPARRTEIDGRLGWWFVLSPPPHKEHPLEVVIDDATGVILELRSVGIDNYKTLTNFVPDAEITDERFVYNGTVRTDQADKRRREEEDRRLAQEMDWPTPRYWPTGLQIVLIDANPETRSFIGYIEGVDGLPILARWLKGESAPKRLAERSDGQHIHSWSNGKWEWALAVSQPLEAIELERVIASIPVDE
jgi:hypothetical protein